MDESEEELEDYLTYGEIGPDDYSYMNEDHSADFDDEDSAYFLGGGKGW